MLKFSMWKMEIPSSQANEPMSTCCTKKLTFLWSPGAGGLCHSNLFPSGPGGVELRRCQAGAHHSVPGRVVPDRPEQGITLGIEDRWGVWILFDQ